jgi:hypothetical protein
LETTGNQTVTVTDTATSVQGSSTFLVANYIPGLHFTTSYTATFVQAGTSFNFTVIALDEYGQVATRYLGTIAFYAADTAPGVVLPANYTFTAGDAGVHTFSATLVTAANPAAVEFYDTAWVAGGGPYGGVVVAITPAPASTLLVGGFPSTVTAGASGSFTITAKDPYGNIATGYTGTVHFTSSDPQASLPADYTFQSSDAGVHHFSGSLKTAGMQSLTATDTASPSLTASETGITVTPATVSSLQVSGFPATVVAGTPGSVTVGAMDPFGNVVTGYTGTVHWSSSDPLAQLPADYTFTAADQGGHVFQVTLYRSPVESIALTDVADSSITGSQTGIAVTPAQAAQIMMTYPATVEAGVAFTVVVTIIDAYGNVVPNWTGTVYFQSSDAQAVLPAEYNFTAEDQGSHVFDLTLYTLNQQSLQVFDAAGVLDANPVDTNVVP